MRTTDLVAARRIRNYRRGVATVIARSGFAPTVLDAGWERIDDARKQKERKEKSVRARRQK